MTDETEIKMENIRRMAEELGKEKEYNSLTLDTLVFLTSKEEELNKEKLEYFLYGYFLGYGIPYLVANSIDE